MEIMITDTDQQIINELSPLDEEVLTRLGWHRYKMVDTGRVLNYEEYMSGAYKSSIFFMHDDFINTRILINKDKGYVRVYDSRAPFHHYDYVSTVRELWRMIKSIESTVLPF